MLAHERRVRMLRLLQANERTTVRELAEHLGVTTETIRRDLRVLEQDGAVQRVHGGARLLPRGQAALPVSARRVLHREEKQAIAAAAVNLVDDGDVIALDSSTTVLQLAQRLGERRVSVLTYGLHTAQELARFPSLQVHVVGGVLYHPKDVLVKNETVDALRRLRVDTAFISCTGVDPDYGLTISSSLEADVKRALVSAADNVCLLADSSKLARRGLVSFAGFEDVHKMITDDGIAPHQLVMLQERGVEVIIAPASSASARTNSPGAKGADEI